MRLLVCGGRDYSDLARVEAELDAIHAVTPITLLIHGAAFGADTLAWQWAKCHSVPVMAVPADWFNHGKSAGPKRNAKMLAEGRPNLVLAFPGGRGTEDMVSKAERAGAKVK